MLTESSGLLVVGIEQLLRQREATKLGDCCIVKVMKDSGNRAAVTSERDNQIW